MELSKEMIVHELVYADDTLLIDVNCQVLETFMNCIADVGKEYGLSFNWKKLEMLPIRSDGIIHAANGEVIQKKESMIYLGNILSSDGHITSELSRRIGLACADFSTIDRIWKHSTLGRKKKIEIFNACICSKLAYGLSTSIFTAKEIRRLDGFHARCLRKILKIAPSFYSHISNKTV